MFVVPNRFSFSTGFHPGRQGSATPYKSRHSAFHLERLTSALRGRCLYALSSPSNLARRCGSSVEEAARALVERSAGLILPKDHETDPASCALLAAAKEVSIPVFIYSGDVDALDTFLRGRGRFGKFVRDAASVIARRMRESQSVDKVERRVTEPGHEHEPCEQMVLTFRPYKIRRPAPPAPNHQPDEVDLLRTALGASS